MKLTVIAKSSKGWHQKDLARAAKSRGVDIEFTDIKSTNELPQKAKEFGDAIIWRASSLDTLSERASVQLFIGDTPMLNRSVLEHPFTTYKYYQQAVFAKKAPTLKGILTYRAANKAELEALLIGKKLSYPFIVKPNLGSKGQGIIVVTDETVLATLTNHKKYVYQNFIQNTGDWRVIVVGGRALGVMRRIAKEGSYLNNISQGASACQEDRPKVRRQVIDIALAAAAAFGLGYCGVDIIQDKDTQQFHFMEVNTVPQWNDDQGFAAITGVDVAAEIVDLAISLAERQKLSTQVLVKDYCDRHLAQASKAKALHYASRMYLWTRDQIYRDMLDHAEAGYLGKDIAAVQKRLTTLFEGGNLKYARFTMNSREHFFAKYPLLKRANRLLFKSLFAKTLYGRNVDAEIEKLISDDELLLLFSQLYNDPQAVKVLSTFAVNFFFLLKAYFAKDFQLQTKVLIDPAWFEALFDDYEDLQNDGVLTPPGRLRMQIYLVTHAVIGESQFYNRRVKGLAYHPMLAKAESLISRKFSATNLDCKLEFLVACRLADYDTYLKDPILSDAEHLLHPTANYLTDTHNIARRKSAKLRFIQSEHRNVLFLMASLPFAKDRKPAKKPKMVAVLSASISENPSAIGRLAMVDFTEYGLSGAKARVDSGAFFSAVHASRIKPNLDGSLSFNLLDGYLGKDSGKLITVSTFKERPVKNTSGVYERRYVVDLPVRINGKDQMQSFTLTNRSAMACPVLLGRTFLQSGYVIDVSRQF